VVTTGAMAIAEAVGPPNVWSREKDDLRRAIDPIVMALRAQGLDASAVIRRGAPVEQIAIHARELDADLVVVAHGHPTVTTRWLQSARDARLLDRLPCSLLVVSSAS
jgi:nucleotide-binding universal stress UspA family protein